MVICGVLKRTKGRMAALVRERWGKMRGGKMAIVKKKCNVCGMELDVDDAVVSCTNASCGANTLVVVPPATTGPATPPPPPPPPAGATTGSATPPPPPPPPAGATTGSATPPSPAPAATKGGVRGWYNRLGRGGRFSLFAVVAVMTALVAGPFLFSNSPAGIEEAVEGPAPEAPAEGAPAPVSTPPVVTPPKVVEPEAAKAAVVPNPAPAAAPAAALPVPVPPPAAKSAIAAEVPPVATPEQAVGIRPVVMKDCVGVVTVQGRAVNPKSFRGPGCPTDFQYRSGDGLGIREFFSPSLNKTAWVDFSRIVSVQGEQELQVLIEP
jgi:hypothetical protein